jgi:ABC-2 type transport system permease protein
MSGEVARLDLRLRRRSTLAYAFGVGAYAMLIVALYPSFKSDTSLDDLTASNPRLAALFGAAGSLTSPDGWMNANLYANFLPLFALVMTIGYGGAAIAGQDEDGTLSVVASLPMTRQQLLLEKMGALALLSVSIPLVAFIAALLGRAFELDLQIGPLVQTTITAALLAFDLGLMALAIGAWTGTRGTALGITTTVAALAYVISSLAPVVDWIHAIRYLSPIYWSVGANQIRDGATIVQVLLLVLMGVLLGLGARTGLHRLDIH